MTFGVAANSTNNTVSGPAICAPWQAGSWFSQGPPIPRPPGRFPLPLLAQCWGGVSVPGRRASATPGLPLSPPAVLTAAGEEGEGQVALGGRALSAGAGGAARPGPAAAAGPLLD